MIRSGVYFLGGDKRVRIGEAKDLEKRIIVKNKKYIKEN